MQRGNHAAAEMPRNFGNRALGYVLLLFLVVGIWIIWQIVRRASAGAQAIISPERAKQYFG